MANPAQMLRFIDSATILANASAITAMADLLQRRDLIAPEEMEVLKHFHLHGFDDLLENGDLEPAERQALEDRRGQIERLWPKPKEPGSTPG